MNIRKKIMIAGAALSLLPLITAVIILEKVSADSASEALAHSATNQLISIRDSKKSQIEDYFVRRCKHSPVI